MDKLTPFFAGILCDLLVLVVLLVHRWVLKWKVPATCASFPSVCLASCRVCGPTITPISQAPSALVNSLHLQGVFLLLVFAHVFSSLSILCSWYCSYLRHSLKDRVQTYFGILLSQHDGRDYYLGIFASGMLAVFLMVLPFPYRPPQILPRFLSWCLAIRHYRAIRLTRSCL